MKRKIIIFAILLISLPLLASDNISGQWELFFSEKKNTKNLVSIDKNNDMSVKLNFFRDGTGFIEVKVAHIVEYDPFTWKKSEKEIYIDYRTIPTDTFRVKKDFMYREISDGDYTILKKIN